jgi:hypothetical protein
MPTNYAGDLTLVNPIIGTAPGPGAPPVITLPDDGEAATIGPIVDAFKQVMSEIAWTKAPRPRSTEWDEAILRFRNALGHTRFALDHHGFPAGRIFHATENWLDVGLVPKTAVASDQPWAGNWRYDLSATGMTIEAQWAGAGGQPSPCLHMAAGTTPAVALVYGARDWVLRSPNQVITWQTEICAQLNEIAYVVMEFGLGTMGNDHGVRFVKRAADVNWHLYTNVTGTGVYTDLGVASYQPPGTRQRLRFEMVGANVADVGAAKLLAYIDGNLVGTISYTNVGEESLRPWFRLERTGAGAGTTYHCYLNTLDVCSSLWPSDALL